MHQKSIIRLLKVGDQNTHFFHQVVRGRVIKNRIATLVDDNGNVVTDAEVIEQMVVGFYKALLGSCAPTLQAMDKVVVSRGPTLGHAQCVDLVRPVTTK